MAGDLRWAAPSFSRCPMLAAGQEVLAPPMRRGRIGIGSEHPVNEIASVASAAFLAETAEGILLTRTAFHAKREAVHCLAERGGCGQ